jgi:hypothetical protein
VRTLEGELNDDDVADAEKSVQLAMHVRKRFRIDLDRLAQPVGPSGPLYVTPIDMSVNVPSERKHSTQPLTSTFSASSYAPRMICSLFMGKSFLFDLKKLRAQGRLSKKR